MIPDGKKTTKLSSDQEAVFVRLLEVQRTRSLLRIQDGRGREVPAAFRSLTRGEAVLAAERPLDLEAGDGTQLVFILHDLRYTARATVLSAQPCAAVLALPRRIELAERRKRSRNYLGVAFLGLFTPMAAGTLPEPSYAFASDRGPAPQAEERAPEAQNPSIRVGGLLKTGASSSTGGLVFYVQDWLATHPLNPKEHDFSSRLNAVLGPQEQRQKLHRGPFAHGVSYNFLSYPLPDGLQNALNMKGARFELHVDRNDVRLGIRLK